MKKRGKGERVKGEGKGKRGRGCRERMRDFATLRFPFPNKNTGELEPVKVILDATYLNENDDKALWQYIEQNATVDELKHIIIINIRF